jgi:hypothetical protein
MQFEIYTPDLFVKQICLVPFTVQLFYLCRAKSGVKMIVKCSRLGQSQTCLD